MSKKIKREDYETVTFQQIRFLEKSCRDFDNGDDFEGIRIAGHLRTILHDSHIKKNYDGKLNQWVEKLGEMVEEGVDNKKIKIKLIRKIKGISDKLVHQQKKQILSKSLLTQIGKKNIKFIDTSVSGLSFTKIDSLTNTFVNLTSHYGLVAKNISTNENLLSVTYSPLCLHEGFKEFISNCRWVSFEDWWHQIIFADPNGVKFSRKQLVQLISNQDGYAHIDENIDLEYQAFKQANILEEFYNTNDKAISNLVTLNSVRQIAYETLYSLEMDIK